MMLFVGGSTLENVLGRGSAVLACSEIRQDVPRSVRGSRGAKRT